MLDLDVCPHLYLVVYLACFIVPFHYCMEYWFAFFVHRFASNSIAGW